MYICIAPGGLNWVSCLRVARVRVGAVELGTGWGEQTTVRKVPEYLP